MSLKKMKRKKKIMTIEIIIIIIGEIKTIIIIKTATIIKIIMEITEERNLKNST